MEAILVAWTGRWGGSNSWYVSYCFVLTYLHWWALPLLYVGHFRDFGLFCLSYSLQCKHSVLTSASVSKQCRPWSDATVCGVWSGSAIFACDLFYRFPDRNGLATFTKAVSFSIDLLNLDLYWYGDIYTPPLTFEQIQHRSEENLKDNSESFYLRGYIFHRYHDTHSARAVRGAFVAYENWWDNRYR